MGASLGGSKALPASEWIELLDLMSGCGIFGHFWHSMV